MSKTKENEKEVVPIAHHRDDVVENDVNAKVAVVRGCHSTSSPWCIKMEIQESQNMECRQKKNGKNVSVLTHRKNNKVGVSVEKPPERIMKSQSWDVVSAAIQRISGAIAVSLNEASRKDPLQMITLIRKNATQENVRKIQ